MTDAIFIVRQFQEKYLAKERNLYIAFVDLKRLSGDRVPVVGNEMVGLTGIVGGESSINVFLFQWLNAQ